ncbi:hypothetical protein BMS3Abin05_00035 [bacterium BMS3Abin05]|nr:hypothetical protein BMS3Abin05_00035 [bacterium BMS3Abin05]
MPVIRFFRFDGDGVYQIILRDFSIFIPVSIIQEKKCGIRIPARTKDDLLAVQLLQHFRGLICGLLRPDGIVTPQIRIDVGQSGLNIIIFRIVLNRAPHFSCGPFVLAVMVLLSPSFIDRHVAGGLIPEAVVVPVLGLVPKGVLKLQQIFKIIMPHGLPPDRLIPGKIDVHEKSVQPHRIINLGIFDRPLGKAGSRQFLSFSSP